MALTLVVVDDHAGSRSLARARLEVGSLLAEEKVDGEALRTLMKVGE